jgi:hypothetical protein
MRAHIIENGFVVNTIVVDSLDYMPNLVEATEGGIGWSYVDGIFTAPVITLTAEQVRSVRNDKLIKSDWTQVDDAPVDKAAWANYRQLLRDITGQEGFPHRIEWPLTP